MLIQLAKRSIEKGGRVLLYANKQSRFLASAAKKQLKPGTFKNGTPYPDANDLPVPEGTYAEWYGPRNKKYTLFMCTGILAAIASIFLFVTKEEVDFNWCIPDLIEEEEEEAEEASDKKSKDGKDSKDDKDHKDEKKKDGK